MKFAWHSIKCFFGYHDWIFGNETTDCRSYKRKCQRCGKKMFFINHGKWVDEP